MSQGFAGGLGRTLSRIFGGSVVLHPGSPNERAVDLIFRLEPEEIEGAQGEVVEDQAPILRGPRDEMETLSPGDRVDARDGHLYRVRYLKEARTPAPDGLVSARLERIT